jgi:hypothetical protein
METLLIRCKTKDDLQQVESFAVKLGATIVDNNSTLRFSALNESSFADDWANDEDYRAWQDL